MSIIAISGKSGSGKDTVGEIIQWLVWKRLVMKKDSSIDDSIFLPFTERLNKGNYDHKQGIPEIKKFATKLKQITCMMLGCTLEQLEDQEFKNRYLNREWQVDFESTPRTYRWFLQTLGTESTREMIHGNFWINGLFADYRVSNVKEGQTYSAEDFPKWIITDLRFKNELEAIKQHQGITIRVNRKREDKYYYNAEYCNLESLKETIKQETGEYPLIEYCKNFHVAEHESEIALDKAKFDFVIDNNGTIEELIEKVREILIEINIIE